MRAFAADIGGSVGKKAKLLGWVGARRDHGKLIFIDLRDRSGLAQCVFNAKEKILFSQAEKLRPEWIIEVIGEISQRPKNLINSDLGSGRWEVMVKKLTVLSEAKTPPIALDTDGYEIGEESRLRYRYLDLRRPRLQQNLKLRHSAIKFIRDYLDERNFVEVETPILSKSTPEGARDYLVPSRLYHGQFFALPQSPQQYKQLLMIAGLEKYYQIARCFRDEDTRGDRQPEFTQLDLEMSFIDREEVMNLIEDLYVKLVSQFFPAKIISRRPFPRLTYSQAIKKYKSDKPDLRKNKNDKNELAFVWIDDFPFFRKDKDGNWTFTHNPFSAPVEEHVGWLSAKKNIGKITADQYDLVLNGQEIGGGSIRAHQPEVLRRTFQIIGLSDKKIDEEFGYMIEALASGAPPHGGIAMGLDRFLAILLNEPNIREVIAFPKTGDGRDLLMEAPNSVSKEQLKELGLEKVNES